ncbi:disA bacterial checkpoint controller nucleotide-binding domain-containing protein [Ditylenchus destructor]|nr:disA bacterial checkpoint controller nucleotide-binding domain-containing protein [Ditylenchus destructor]
MDPQHDGAVILSVIERQIKSAANKITTDPVDYSVSEDAAKLKRLGTRHWSAFSLSHYTSAPIVVVSNEKGRVSLFHRGKLTLGVTKEYLAQMLWDIYSVRKQGDAVSDASLFDEKHFTAYYSAQPFNPTVHSKWFIEHYVHTRLQLYHDSALIISYPKLEVLVKPGTKGYRYSHGFD